VRRLSQDEYWAAMNLVGSDHRPVAASFSLESNPDIAIADRVTNRLIRKHNQVIGQRCSVLMTRAMYITLNHSSKWRRYCGKAIPGSDISYQWNDGSISGPVPCVVCGRNIKISRQQFEIVRGEQRDSYKWETLNESTKKKTSMLKRFSTGMMSRVMSSRGRGRSWWLDIRNEETQHTVLTQRSENGESVRYCGECLSDVHGMLSVSSVRISVFSLLFFFF